MVKRHEQVITLPEGKAHWPASQPREHVVSAKGDCGGDLGASSNRGNWVCNPETLWGLASANSWLSCLKEPGTTAGCRLRSMRGHHRRQTIPANWTIGAMPQTEGTQVGSSPGQKTSTVLRGPYPCCFSQGPGWEPMERDGSGPPPKCL